MPELFVGVGSGPHVHPRRHHQAGLAYHCPDRRTDDPCMWQLPPHRMKQPPRQRVEPPPDIVRPPAAANLAPRVDLNHPGTHLPKTGFPREQKEWVLWQKHSAGPYAKGIFKRSIDEHRDCVQRSQSTSSKEDARPAKEPRCDSNKCLESARRQPAAQIEIEKITRAYLPREKRSTGIWGR